jgi:ATP/maltotriose-dependent transcriptional regulator MalT
VAGGTPADMLLRRFQRRNAAASAPHGFGTWALAAQLRRKAVSRTHATWRQFANLGRPTRLTMYIAYQ